MPCRVDPIHVNYSSENQSLLRVVNIATAGLDRAREAILADQKPDLSFIKKMDRFKNDHPNFVDGKFGLYPPYSGVMPDEKLIKEFNRLYKEAYSYLDNKAKRQTILARQRKHRKEDIKRLRITFAKKGREDLLEKTLGINYDEPLEPQLGFDPDSY